ncbi:hypothetical protein WBQ28_24475 [Pseudomonas syringae pv. syringae]|uniref:hypothetical protein n=1 Tax=Pseudomonas syringae TaxID=317 RepID=UPI003AFF654C
MKSEPSDYFLKLEAIHPKLLIEIFIEKSQPKGFRAWFLKNEIKPVDLYCYLYAKYGPPNGIMNLLRGDSSENMVHWEWALFNDDGLIMIQGHNFRTDIQFLGDFKHRHISKGNFITQIKTDLKNYGKRMSLVRTQLEKWIEFVNPFHNIQSTIETQILKLSELKLSPENDRVPSPTSAEELSTYQERFSEASQKYIFGTGLAFGLRCMLPVLAETFINLLIFVLTKNDIKLNTEMYKSFVSDTINNRLKSLHTNCVGFDKPVDDSNIACRGFYQLMNDRNDLLHGNFNLEKLKIGDVYFNGKVPVFYEYGDLWEDTIGVTIEAVKLQNIEKSYDTVKAFIAYLLSLLSPDKKVLVEDVMMTRDLGYYEKYKRLGILFPNTTIDTIGYFESEFSEIE